MIRKVSTGSFFLIVLIIYFEILIKRRESYLVIYIAKYKGLN